MTYRGRVKDGTIVLEPGTSLPEGTEVLIQPVEPATTENNEADGRNIWQKLMELSGTAQGLPADLPKKHEYRRKRLEQ